MSQQELAKGLTKRMVKGFKLHTQCPLDRISYETSNDIPRSKQIKHFQPRAFKALELAVNIDKLDYNIYLSSEPNLGRSSIVTEFLKPYAKKKQTPPDLLYVNNFEDQDRPILLYVPAGTGKLLKNGLAKTVLEIRKELIAKFETDNYIKNRSKLLDDFNDQKNGLLKEMNTIASERNFLLDFEDKNSITLFPVMEGKKISDEEFATLDKDVQDTYNQHGDVLLQILTEIIRKISKIEADYKDNEKNLDKSIMEDVLNRLLNPFLNKFIKALKTVDKFNEHEEALKQYFELLRQDMLDNFDIFLPKDHQGQSHHQNEHLSLHHESEIYRYEINLFVDNSQTKGAPILYEDNPTSFNLLGSIERESEMGTLITDFTLIKAGSLHKALGGYLIIHLEDILQYTNAWEGLMRTLRASVSRIHESAEQSEAIRTKGIEPAPIPLDLKFILIGTDNLYEKLITHDERFAKFFKIKAQLVDTCERNSANIKQWLASLTPILDSEDLLPFTKSALAALVDFSSLLSHDQKKLSLKFSIIRDVMLEASTLAKIAQKTIVDVDMLELSLSDRKFRHNYLEEELINEYCREMIHIQTDGFAVGKVNALSVTMYGDYEFGLPHQISCTAGVGHGGIIDLEREAELGGPIHTKAVMILKSYLINQFAQNKPLVLTGSLCLEQCYAGIDGDSASGAELAALLSAIAEQPINLSLAFTGALSPSGKILSVGFVTKKIEGFFAICNYRGLTGKQGVIIPYVNKDNLMLDKKVKEAVDQGLFHIYPVKTINEALTLLTGLSCGNLRKDKTYTKNSFFEKVDNKLKLFGWLADNSFKTKPRI